jgi:hypothetical protein
LGERGVIPHPFSKSFSRTIFKKSLIYWGCGVF